MDFSEFRYSNIEYADCRTIEKAMRRACKINDVATLKWISDTWTDIKDKIHPTINKSIAKTICRKNYIAMAIYLLTDRYTWNVSMLLRYCTIEFFMRIEKYYEPNIQLYVDACQNSDSTIVKYMINNWPEIELNQVRKFLSLIFRHSDLDLVQIVYNKWPCLFDNDNVILYFCRALIYGHLDVCEWIVQRWSHIDFAREFLIGRGSKNNTDVHFFFENSYLDIIKWLSDITDYQQIEYILIPCLDYNYEILIDYIIVHHAIQTTDDMVLNNEYRSRLNNNIKRIWSMSKKSARKI